MKGANQSPPPPHTQSLLSALCVPGLCVQEALTGRKTERERQSTRRCRRDWLLCDHMLKHATVIYPDAAMQFIKNRIWLCARIEASQWTLHTYTCPLLNPDTNRHYPDAAAPSEINHGLSTSLPLSLYLVVCQPPPPPTSQFIFWHD